MKFPPFSATAREPMRLVPMWLPPMNVPRLGSAYLSLRATRLCWLQGVRFGFEVERMHGLSLLVEIDGVKVWGDPMPLAELEGVARRDGLGGLKSHERVNLELRSTIDAHIEARPYLTAMVQGADESLPFDWVAR